MPERVGYVQKILEISEVLMRGKVEHRAIDQNDRDSGTSWFIGRDNLDEWLARFDGKSVTLEIKTFERDESHLLPTTPEPAAAEVADPAEAR